eukprot:2647019-Lingulodinium_polyedra.AAC.1
MVMAMATATVVALHSPWPAYFRLAGARKRTSRTAAGARGSTAPRRRRRRRPRPGRTSARRGRRRP